MRPLISCAGLALLLLAACDDRAEDAAPPMPAGSAGVPAPDPDAYSDTLMGIGAGWMAHMICSGLFVSNRDIDSLMAVEFGPGADPGLALMTPVVDAAARRVSVTVEDSDIDALAVHRDGLGCTLVLDGDADALQAERTPPLPPRSAPAEALWPEGSALARDLPDIDYGALDAALAQAVRHGEGELGTRAVAVVHRGRLLGEAYGPGTTPRMAHYGASMTKSVTALLIGRLMLEGRLSLEARALRPEWRGADDPRREITFDQLLKAVSGLEFQEVYDGESDANVMLMTRPDAAAYAAAKPLVAPPGTRWSYSSGTTNILMSLARATFNGDTAAWYAFPNDALFAPLGLTTAVFETDTSGTFVGSSFLWASARDFARLGLFMLRDGVWEGERLLPEGWIAHITTPHPGNSENNYGGQVWLESAQTEDGPVAIHEMRGYGGQYVTMVPAIDLAVVRLGWDFGAPEWDQESLVREVAAALGAR